MRLSPLSVLPVLAALVAGSVLSGGPAAGVTPTVTAPALSWDFDGDGIRDLAAGQVGNEEGGPGQVLVRRGTADGYGPATVLQHPEAPEGNEGFGTSLASADLDLDGYADLVVGARATTRNRTATARSPSSTTRRPASPRKPRPARSGRAARTATW